MFNTPLSQAGAVLMVLVCGFALIRGERTERVAALAQIANWVGSTLVQDRRPHHHGQPLMFIADLAYLLVLIYLTLKSQRVWVLFASGFQLLIILTHVAYALAPHGGQWVFFSAYLIWSWAVLAAMAIGAALEPRRIASPLLVEHSG